MNDSCANVFCSRSGDRSGPVKNGDCTLWVRTRWLAIVPVPPQRPATQPVTYDGTPLLLFANVGGIGRGRPRRERGGFEPGEIARHHVARDCSPPGRPPMVGDHDFVIPGGDRAVGGERDALVDDEGEAVVLPGHLVLARQLHAHRLADGLRKQRGIVRDRVGAVASVAARTHLEHDVHVVRLQAEQHRGAALQRIDGLRCRPDRGLAALNVRDRARGADRSVHLIGIEVGGFHHPGRAANFSSTSFELTRNVSRVGF